MSKNKNKAGPTPPEQMSRALAKSLRRFDKTLARQREQVVELAELIVRTCAEVAAEGRGQPGAVDDAVIDRLVAAVKASFEVLEEEADALELPDPEHEAGEDWEAELRQAVAMAWQNAVEASQSLHAVAEQALTQGLSLLFSVAGDALSEPQELALDALTPTSALPAGNEPPGFASLDDPYAGYRDDVDDDWD